jgi:hypothetical protein
MRGNSVDITDLTDDIATAAKRAADGWPHMVDADDVNQEIWTRLLESPGTVETVMGLTGHERVALLTRIGHQAASVIRTDYDHFNGNFYYSVNEVRELLKSGALSAGCENTQTERLDIDEGLDGLNNRYARLLFKRYGLVEPMESGADQDALERAVTALARAMNRMHRTRAAEYQDGPGSRRSVSNAHASVITRRQ